jgi:hypothetical protein
MYRILKPFNADGIYFKREQYVDDEFVDSWKNKDQLIDKKFIVNEGDRHCYIVNKAFFGDGKSRSSGDFIDLRNKRWRNERALLKGGYIRYATAEEVQGFSPPRNLSSSVVPENVLEDREYLERRYAETSGLAIAKEIGCHPAKVYKALRKFSIETRPGGFQKK